MTDGGEGDLDSRLLVLDESDNTAVVRQRIDEGETYVVRGTLITAERRLPIGYKIALENIAVGQEIFKYGAPIGMASVNIPKGTIVHMHNMRSEYLSASTPGCGHDAEVDK